MECRSLDEELAREGDSVLHQLSLLASAPADLGYNGKGRLLSPAGSPVKRPSRPRADANGLYPAAATGRCVAPGPRVMSCPRHALPQA